MAKKYDYYKMFPNARGAPGSVNVKGYKVDGYPSYSVMAGSTLVAFLGSFNSVAEAMEAYPGELEADSFGDAYVDATLKSVSHIPDDTNY